MIPAALHRAMALYPNRFGGRMSGGVSPGAAGQRFKPPAKKRPRVPFGNRGGSYGRAAKSMVRRQASHLPPLRPHRPTKTKKFLRKRFGERSGPPKLNRLRDVGKTMWTR